MALAEITEAPIQSNDGRIQHAGEFTAPHALSIAFDAHPEFFPQMDTSIEHIQRAETIREKLLAQLESTHTLNVSSNPGVLELHLLDEKMSDSAQKRLYTVYGTGMDAIKTLETNIAALQSVPSLGTPEQLKHMKHQLRAYKAQKTRHQKEIDPKDGLNREERARYDELSATHKRYAYRHEQQLKKRIAMVEKIAKKAIETVRTSDVVRSPGVFRRLDGRSNIMYSTPEGARAHDSLFFFWTLPKEVGAARAIVRNETAALIQEGQWNVLGGKEFRDLIAMYEFSYGRTFVETIRREIATTVAIHIRSLSSGTAEIRTKRGKPVVSYPSYEMELSPLSNDSVDALFQLMEHIHQYTHNAALGNTAETTTAYIRMSENIAYQTGRLLSPHKSGSAVWTLLSIPGLNIESVADMIYRVGADEHRTGMGFIGRLPLIASKQAKRSPLFDEVLDQAKRRDLTSWPYPSKMAVVTPQAEIKPEISSSTETQWRTVTSVLNDLLTQNNLEAIQLLEKITRTKDTNPADVLLLMNILIQRIPEAIRDTVFPPGQYDPARQLAGQFLSKPDAFVAPAKKRSKEGAVYSTYVVVYQNPLTAASSYDGKH